MRKKVWPVYLLVLPAFVAIWSGWVGLGSLCGFGLIQPLPGIWDEIQLDTRITLPIGVEAYAAYALWAWLGSADAPAAARRFAKWSAVGSLALGMLGQVAFHVLVSSGHERAPVWVVVAVSCLPVIVLGMGAALAHLMLSEGTEQAEADPVMQWIRDNAAATGKAVGDAFGRSARWGRLKLAEAKQAAE